MQLPNYFRKWVTGEKILTQNQVKCYHFYDGHIDCLDLFFSFLDAFQFLQSLSLSLTESHSYSLTLSLSPSISFFVLWKIPSVLTQGLWNSIVYSQSVLLKTSNILLASFHGFLYIVTPLGRALFSNNYRLQS